MLNSYRFPFLLLGIGIGIILTNTIYIFNPDIRYRDYSREEIIAEATDLGMVFIKDSMDIKGDSESVINELEEEKQEEEMQIIIEYGDSLPKVSRELYRLGIIDDTEKFNKYVEDKKMDKRLRVGTYKLSTNLDYNTIIKILTKSVE